MLVMCHSVNIMYVRLTLSCDSSEEIFLFRFGNVTTILNQNVCVEIKWLVSSIDSQGWRWISLDGETQVHVVVAL